MNFKTLVVVAAGLLVVVALLLMAVGVGLYDQQATFNHGQGQGEVEPPQPGPPPGPFPPGPVPEPSPAPNPLPTPDPLPPGDSYTAAHTRALASGRDLVVLYHADWCEPCRWLMANTRQMQGLRGQGELAIVNTDTREGHALYEASRGGGADGIPAVAVYANDEKGLWATQWLVGTTEIARWLDAVGQLAQ